MKKILVALAAALTFTGGVVAYEVQPALAATYMGTGWYWYSGDSKIYCNVGLIHQADGSVVCTGGSTAGYWLVKYPGSSSYCYRRNANYIKRWADGRTFTTQFSGSLYYIC